VLWNVYPHVFSPAAGHGQAGSRVSPLISASLDDALAKCEGEPLTFEVRGEAVTLDEFRRLVREEPNAAAGDFVVFSANRERIQSIGA